jgi:hypothetical protein
MPSTQLLIPWKVLVAIGTGHNSRSMMSWSLADRPGMAQRVKPGAMVCESWGLKSGMLWIWSMDEKSMVHANYQYMILASQPALGNDTCKLPILAVIKDL